jgi:deazaflavin-dependent oxidoreductase (nitroreductase family)
MTIHLVSAFHALVQKVATSRLGIALFSNLLPHLDRAFFRLSRGRTILSGILSGLPVVILTTTGARSGLPRITPLLFFCHPDDPNRLGVIASNWGKQHRPGWYYNLKVNPLARGAIDGVTNTYRAHEARDEEYARYWQVATQDYRGYLAYRQRSGWHIPIMVLVPSDPAASMAHGNVRAG